MSVRHMIVKDWLRNLLHATSIQLCVEDSGEEGVQNNWLYYKQ